MTGSVRRRRHTSSCQPGRRSSRRRSGAARAAALTLLFVAVGCNPREPDRAATEGELVVFAAASLRDAFNALGGAFERLHPKVEVTFNFAGTQELGTQLEHGAVADVIASADQHQMQELVRASRAGSSVIFARNEPVVILANEVRDSIRSFAELPNATRIVIGTPEVPIGRYTLEILDRAADALGTDFRSRIESRVVSRELNVRQVLAKVSLGEAQAGFVYRTDAESALDRVTVLSIPAEVNVIADYPIALVTPAPHPLLGRAWVDAVLSQAGQRTLRDAGFLAPKELATAP